MRQAIEEAENIKVKVPFTRANAFKCLCRQCPVQSGSACVKSNVEKIGDIVSSRVFNLQVMPGLYCSSGVAPCKDIDTHLSCFCSGCPVYEGYNLGKGQPPNHFCENGLAK